jgi:hypothetical protein
MRVCLGCGEAFVMRNPSGKARRAQVREGRFCSRSCFHRWMRQPVQLSLFDQRRRGPGRSRATADPTPAGDQRAASSGDDIARGRPP